VGPSSSEFATQFSLDVIRNTLKYRSHLDCRRRVALFACSSDFAGATTISSREKSSAKSETPHAKEDETGNLLPVLTDFSVIGTARDPEDALRQLLLQFPFLPLDAGEGVDRVIRSLARVYLDTHPDEYSGLRNNDKDCARDESHDDAESAVYILIYAVIMLNTDLNNSKIRHKMKPHEFVRSARSTVLGTHYNEVDLLRIYESVASEPLRICSLEEQRRLSNLLDVNTRRDAALSSGTLAASSSSGAHGWGFPLKYVALVWGNGQLMKPNVPFLCVLLAASAATAMARFQLI
jgi:hypothetical protein